MLEVAEIVGEAAGNTLDFVQIPIEEVYKMSEDYALMLEWFERVGYNVNIEGISRESGITPTTLVAWAQEIDWS